ncbi:hypothetical protein Ctob_002310, partial [Chrysochromulina tobinii]
PPLARSARTHRRVPPPRRSSWRSRRCVRRHRRRIAPSRHMLQSRNLVERATQVPEARVRAATMLQRMVRGRAARRIHLLLRLAARVQDTYRREQPAYENETSINAGGVARRLEGTLLKLSGIVYQQRNVYVSQLHFRYSSRQSDVYKAVDLADRCELLILSNDRFEFALSLRGGAKEIKFRAQSRESFDRWTSGLARYLSMAQAYYTL